MKILYKCKVKIVKWQIKKIVKIVKKNLLVAFICKENEYEKKGEKERIKQKQYVALRIEHGTCLKRA